MANQNNTIAAWGVYYVPNREGKLFAGLKSELQLAFLNQRDALDYCSNLSMCGALDELHIGYRVYPMNWVPRGVKVN